MATLTRVAAADALPGDRIETDSGVQIVRTVTNGIYRGHVCLTYKSGEHSEIHHAMPLYVERPA